MLLLHRHVKNIINISVVGVFFACIISFSISCSNKKDSNLDYELSGQSNDLRTWQAVDTLSIIVDSVTSPTNYFGQIKIVNSDTLYIIFNPNINALQAYSLNSKKMAWKILLEKEGPNAVDSEGKFYYHTNDSIFFFSEYPVNKLKIVTSQGNVIKTINVPLPDGYWTSLNMFNELKYISETKSIAFPIYPEINSSADLTFYEKARLCTFNLENRNLNTLGAFPKQFYENDYVYSVFDFFEYYTAPSNKVLYFHPTSEIQVYSLLTDSLLHTYRIPSKYIKQKTRPYMKLGQDRPDMQQEQNYLTTEPFYVRMMTNQDGSLHYRIVKHRAQLRYVDGKMRKFHDKKFSVMVLDNQFRVIDEVMFKGGIFDFYQAFAVGNKFYMSFNNPLNKNSREDAMQFVVFKLK